MLHKILYSLHIIGMASIISIAIYLSLKKDFTKEVRNKLSIFLVSSAHAQILTGFILFFLMLSEVNHMKVGIKMLLAIEVAAVSTLYRKKISKSETPNPVFIIIVLFSSITAALIAFLV